jgi:hypothetical protein
MLGGTVEGKSLRLASSLRYASCPAEVKPERENQRRCPGIHRIEDERFVSGDEPDEKPEQRHVVSPSSSREMAGFRLAEGADVLHGRLKPRATRRDSPSRGGGAGVR